MTCARISKWRPVLPGIHWRSHRGQFPVRYRRSLRRAPRRHTAHRFRSPHTSAARALTPDATLYVILRAATPRSGPDPYGVSHGFFTLARLTVRRPTKIPDRTVHFYFQNGWVPPPFALPPSAPFELTPVPDAGCATCLAGALPPSVGARPRCPRGGPGREGFERLSVPRFLGEFDLSRRRDVGMRRIFAPASPPFLPLFHQHGFFVDTRRANATAPDFRRETIPVMDVGCVQRYLRNSHVADDVEVIP